MPKYILYGFFILMSSVLFFSCKKKVFPDEYSKQIVGKWKWIYTKYDTIKYADYDWVFFYNATGDHIVYKNGLEFGSCRYRIRINKDGVHFTEAYGDPTITSPYHYFEFLNDSLRIFQPNSSSIPDTAVYARIL